MSSDSRRLPLLPLGRINVTRVREYLNVAFVVRRNTELDGVTPAILQSSVVIEPAAFR